MSDHLPVNGLKETFSLARHSFISLHTLCPPRSRFAFVVKQPSLTLAAQCISFPFLFVIPNPSLLAKCFNFPCYKFPAHEVIFQQAETVQTRGWVCRANSCSFYAPALGVSVFKGKPLGEMVKKMWPLDI